MTKPAKRIFTAEFKLEAAQLVTHHGYSVIEAAKAMNDSQSAMVQWVRQLKQEQQGIVSKISPLMPEQIAIRALKKKVAQLEQHNDILKKATALLMSEALNCI